MATKSGTCPSHYKDLLAQRNPSPPTETVKLTRMSTIYIDQATGIDAASNGTIDRPYQTLAYAIFTAPPSEVDSTVYQIRKNADAEYDTPTQSAAKKAKKDAQGLEKKRLKAEAEEKEARERQERREKRLEESRKVVLVEDPSLATSTKVSPGPGFRFRGCVC